jgi:hypothetical protein
MNRAGGRRPLETDGYILARREAIRRFHPDRGGDAAALVEALHRIDRQYGRTAPLAGELAVVHVRRRGISRLRRRANRRRTAVRRLRGALPRSFPGARRYAQL